MTNYVHLLVDVVITICLVTVTVKVKVKLSHCWPGLAL